MPRAVLEADRGAARSRFGIAPEARCLLVFGGSLGARSINLAALEAFAAAVAVGDNVLIFFDRQYSINPTVGLRCDAFDIVIFVEKARLMAPKDARTEELFIKAADLYQGEFLPTIHMTWVTPHRMKLQEAYLDALMGRSHCRFAWEDYRGAEELLNQALTLEPYREDIHRLLLSCYAAAGKRQQLVAHYDHMMRLFERDLKTKPATETVVFYQSLLNT